MSAANLIERLQVVSARARDYEAVLGSEIVADIRKVVADDGACGESGDGALEHGRLGVSPHGLAVVVSDAEVLGGLTRQHALGLAGHGVVGVEMAESTCIFLC